MHKEFKKELEKRVIKFIQYLKKEIYTESINLNATYSEFTEWVPFKNRLALDYTPIKEGEKWGHAWNSAWFHVTGRVPNEWRGKCVAARLQFDSELLVYGYNGEPSYALTNASVWDAEYIKDRIIIVESALGEESVSIWLEAACNGIFGLACDPDPDRNDPARHGVFNGQIKTLKLSIFDRELYSLLMDFEVLNSLIEVLEKGIPRREKILYSLNKAIDLYRYDRKNLNVAKKITKELLSKKNSDSAMETIAVGHAHLDTGWLWPVKESIRKAARTFAHQIKLIEQYDEYVFGASQPQHFKFIKDFYPELYRKIKKYAAEGRIELQGGMWVEADCNLISGESMIRQILHGKNFFMDEFGVDVDNLWLPDVFGYSAAMPQILRKSGIKTFMTQKISWSQFNIFPHHTFVWEGIDGSEILTHFLPANTYNAYLTPKELVLSERRFVENDVLDNFLTVFGIGDGGGGPKDDQLERAIRMKNLEGVPKVKLGPAKELFSKLHEKEEFLSKWEGELYLELHRGTLTTQSLVKKRNRNLEQFLNAAEKLASLLPYEQYPKEQLDKIYKILLINQFHDILPGSSINKVYETTKRELAECITDVNKLMDEVALSIFDEDESSVVIINNISYNYNGVVLLPFEFERYDIYDDSLKLKSQICENGLAVSITLKPFEIKTVKLVERIVSKNEVKSHNSLTLENDLVRYKFSVEGKIIEGYDKEVGKLFLSEGNIFSLYADRPSDWDAWEVDLTYENMLLENAVCKKIGNFEGGEIYNSLSAEYLIGVSEITQHFYLDRNCKALKTETKVKWNEKHKMLRLSHCTTIKSEMASYDIQYGYVKRPTHRNTSWDLAKFEVAAHKYVDLSDSDYGVSLINDCKYGHKILGSVIDLNILRSPTSPDPDADIGEHTFVTEIYPHTEALNRSYVYEKSLAMNFKPTVLHGLKNSKKVEFPFNVEISDGVSLEVVKHAEKENAHILRLVETKGRAGFIVLKFKENTELHESDIVEWNSNVISSAQTVRLEFKPFEIRTFKFHLC